MRQLNDEKLQNMLSSMRTKAPEGLKGSIMEKVMVYKPKRSPLLWFAPAAGVFGLALVLMISLGVFTNGSMGGIASNENIPAAEVLMMDADAEESDTFAARTALPVTDDSATNGMVGYGGSSEAPSETLAPKAIFAREEVPIGGVVSTSPSGYSTVNLSAKIQNNQSQTVMLLSGLQDNNHWKGILTELNKISDPFIRTDNYGNFMVDVGIFEESIEIFDEKVSSQLSYPDKTDQGSVLFRVQIYK
ncbi:MAG: hypothetical protein R2883_01170 [Caldisericia bacterium]